MEVQGALGHAGSSEDLGDGGRRVSALREDGRGGFQNSASGPDSSFLLSHEPSRKLKIKPTSSYHTVRKVN
ncbi:hypothetical protein GCM10010521_67710 [Streptomyces rameus]|uniref:Uncharacterized protein n=1 Tax=Streptomyces rameus TaxID=68261 RepID=A0ABN3V5H6_9ACTN